MYLSKEELKEAAMYLPDTMSNVKNVLLRIVEDPDNDGNTVDIIDRDACIATILWIRQDIKVALEGRGVAQTEKNVDKVINHCRCLKDIESKGISAGWDVIENAVYDIFK